MIENKKLIYSLNLPFGNIIECFKLLDIDETIDNAYEIQLTNNITNEISSLTTNTPQGAIALADQVKYNLESL